MRAEEANEQDLRLGIVRPLGRGGSGNVYEARDRRTGERVALKELIHADPASLLRFKNEFRRLVNIHHPHLVELKELVEQDGRWFILMELVEGQDLLEFVQASGRSTERAAFDLPRLRQAFGDMARGLLALHEHGVLHRDLKPSNVRINRKGRAVLLDFGLATSVDPSGQSTHAAGLGTALYMAPEQVFTGKLSPAADWYAFGACLYEALTGRPPIEGHSSLKVAIEKQRLVPPAPSTLVGDVPPELCTLCMELLRITPEQRPEGPEVLRRLGGPISTHPQAPLAGTTPPARFTGRDTELEHLENALERTLEGQLQIVLVEGESGVGKSELVAEFVRRQRLKQDQLIALHGRCYENERVAYKAFDGCMDELAPVLSRLEHDSQSFVPPHAALLAQLFPVLAGVSAISRSPIDDCSADPTARRLEAFTAFAHLLRNLAEEYPLILVVDDLQWADPESFRLLRALVEGRVRPPVLIVATVRPRDELEPDVLDAITAVRNWRCVEVVRLLGLSRAQAEGLARSLLGPHPSEHWVHAIASESGGHPLFLMELLRYTVSRVLADDGAVTLEAALQARIKALDDTQQALLELVTLAARPHPVRTFARALGKPIDDAARALLAAKLLRRRRDQELGCYHDRIRTVAVGLIARTRLPRLHRQLAEALDEDPWADPTEQARHWDLAGEQEKACIAYERAARHTFDALAFDQAERLYGRAIELLGERRDERYVQLTAERARALACAGNTREAAFLYQHSAVFSRGEQQLRLRARAARSLMLSLQLDAGLQAFRALLGELGISLPEGTLPALLKTVWERLCTKLQRTLRPERPPQDDAHQRLVLDLTRDALAGLSCVHTPAYLALLAHYVRRALRGPSLDHRALGWIYEGFLTTLGGSLKQAVPQIARGRALLQAAGRPDIEAAQASAEGSARLAGWDWRGGAECLERAQAAAQLHCPEDPWQLTSIRYHLGIAWYHLGEHTRLAQESERWLSEARERNDSFSTVLLAGMGHGSLRHLMHGEPEDALRELDEAIAPLPDKPFGFAQYGHLIGTQRALIARGGAEALAWLDARKNVHRRALLLRSRTGRESMLFFRAFASLSACQDESPARVAELLEATRRIAARIDGRTAFASGQQAILSAQVAALRGRSEQALEQARKARRLFQESGYFAVHSASFLEGTLEGGRAGREKCEAALTFFRQQNWRDPSRPIRMTLCALPAIQAGRGSTPGKKRLLLGRYEVLGPLGRGGFGRVVEARDAQTGRRVALKELVNTSARALERFKREFRALSDLHHPNLVEFETLLEVSGTWYMVMESVGGVDLLAYVRGAEGLDLRRLRTAFTGLCAGLQAMHDAGLVHRDVSPQNVIVTADGRAVLLDFGLVARIHGGGDDAAVAGTLEYAAPEQMAGAPPHPAADVYALGSCLYHALTGQLPFAADNPALLIPTKATQAPPPLPSSLPAALRACCLRMLSPHPAARPSLREVLSCLTDAGALLPRAARPTLASIPDAQPRPLFAGRGRELQALARALQKSKSGFRLVLIEGESGLGKSALLGEFGAQVLEAEPEAWVLSSRCYENELLVHKAFDGTVDQLAAQLRSLPAPACAALLPKKTSLLAQIFPVLGSVPLIAQAHKKGLPADPAARRLAGLSCFTQLLSRIARERPLVLLIDDLHWADLDSFALLQQLARRGDQPSGLVVCTSQPRAAQPEQVQAQLQALLALPQVEALALGKLDTDEASALAGALLGLDAPPPMLARLIDESAGHPLLLRELIEHAKSGQNAARAPSLDEAIGGRVAALDPRARALLELTALFGKPCPPHVLARALEREELPAEALSRLLSSALLRRRGSGELACFHDRIRVVVLAGLDADRRRQLSARLAAALEAWPHDEAAERARLWDDAGYTERAIACHALSGDAALAHLAFGRAEQHFARALTLLGDTRCQRWLRLTVQRAHALVRAGRSAEAASLFSAASEVATGEEKVRLRIWTAQHLIQSTQVADGIEVANGLLHDLGIPLPRTRLAALGDLFWENLRLKLRGTDLAQSIPSKTTTSRLALAALNDLSQPISTVTFLEGTVMAARHLRLALDSGDSAHAASALAYAATLRTAQAPQRDHTELFIRARELAAQTRNPAITAVVELRYGVACLIRFAFREALTTLLACEEFVQAHCPDEPWLQANLRARVGNAALALGDYATLAHLTERWTVEARAKGDLYAYAALTTYGGGFVRHLMRDDPGAAMAELDAAMQPWPQEPFSMCHYGEAVGRASVLLYEGGSAARSWFHAQQERFERAELLKVPACRSALAGLRAAAAMLDWGTSAATTGASPLREAQRQARELWAVGTPYSRGRADLITAGTLALRGRREKALAVARRARDTLAQFENHMLPPARYLAALLEGGSQAELVFSETVRGYAEQGWSAPARALQVLLPPTVLLTP